jgi:hypothetical protein
MQISRGIGWARQTVGSGVTPEKDKSRGYKSAPYAKVLNKLKNNLFLPQINKLARLVIAKLGPDMIVEQCPDGNNPL